MGFSCSETLHFDIAENWRLFSRHYIGQYNFGSAYWQGLCQHFFGINKVDVLTAEGLDILGADTTAIMNEAKKKAVTLAGQLSAII